MALYCTKCKKQGIGSTEDWKPRLRNYKSCIKRCVFSCSIVRHFFDDCPGDDNNPSKYLRFVLVDYVSVSVEERYHDWRRMKRIQKFKIRD